MNTTGIQLKRQTRLQTPRPERPKYHGKTIMRQAFEDAEATAGHRLIPRILQGFKAGRGTWVTSGWKAPRRGKRRGKRNRKGALPRVSG